MPDTQTPIDCPPAFPDHTQLPASDGNFVKSFQEHPQSILVTDSLKPSLEQLHPDGQYVIGQDCGIYWQQTDPPEQGAAAPDWFYVPNVSPRINNQIRRSVVLWREYAAPLVALEFASGDGSEERDRTPLSSTGAVAKPGKFWVYERIIRIPYLGVFIVNTGQFEFYHLIDFRYQRLEPNERGHYAIPPLAVEIGLWRGAYLNQAPEDKQLWLRWWDLEGNLLLTGHEQAAVERQRTRQAQAQAARLAARLRTLGIDPEDLAGDHPNP